MGTQYSEYYGTSSAKVLIGWELPNELQPPTSDRAEQPHLVWKRFTCSLHKKAALRSVLESWRGKPFTREELQGFDLKNLLDVPCMLNVVHQESGENTYANVAAVMAMPKGNTVPDRVSDLVYFNITEWNEKVFETFSDNLKETIRKSSEYKAVHNVQDDEPPRDQHEHEDEVDDDIPFGWLLPWLLPAMIIPWELVG